jgi:hypothetical protein
MTSKSELLNQAATEGEKPSIPNDGHFFGQITAYTPTGGDNDKFGNPVINIYLKIAKLASDYDIERKAIKSWSDDWRKVMFPSLKALGSESADIEGYYCHGEEIGMSAFQGERAFYTTEDKDGNSVRKERRGIKFHAFYDTLEECQAAYMTHYNVETIGETAEIDDDPAAAPAPAPKPVAAPKAAAAAPKRNVPIAVKPDEVAPVSEPTAKPAFPGANVVINTQLANAWKKADEDVEKFTALIAANPLLKVKKITIDSPEVAEFLSQALEDALPF